MPPAQLHPQAQAVLDWLGGASEPQPDAPDPLAELAAVRTAHERNAPWLCGDGPELEEVRDELIAGGAGELSLRIYRPAGAQRLPVVVYLHGGGWVLGTLDAYDTLCRTLSAACGAIVVSVDYRLAPETPFPAAVSDAWTALEWVAGGGLGADADPGRLAVAGDSAGGNLAAAVAIRARDRGAPELRAQVLVYPALDATMDSASYAEFADGPGLTRAEMSLCWSLYLGAAPADAPDASPLHAKSLAGVAPALVIIAAVDPLRDEGERFAERLRDAGVDVRLSRYDGMPHGFFRWLARTDAAHAAVEEAARGLRDALSA